MPEYQFVSFGDGNGPNATKAARSHAIRTALNRRNASAPRQNEPHGASPSEDASKTLSGGLKGRFRLISHEDAKPQQKQRDISQWAPISKSGNSKAKLQVLQSHPAKIPILRLKDNVLDPFDCMPIPKSPAVDALVQFFVKGFKLNFNSTSIDTQRPWLPYAMQSPVVMRATLALAAGFWAASMPSLDVRLRREGYLQKGETMRLIREHLSTAHSNKLTKEDALVLSGMATLANVEAFNGEFTTADVHLRGLYDIVQSRGGTAILQHDYILCRCIKWADVQVASGLGRVPMFPPLHTLDQVTLPPKVVSQAADPPLKYLAEDVSVEPDARAAVRTIFTLLRQSIASQEAGALMDADSIRIVMSTADNYILSFLFAGHESGGGLVSSDGDSLAMDGDDDEITALVLAAHVFLYAALRAVPTTSQLLRNLCCRLRRFLEGVDGAGDVSEAASQVIAGWNGHIALLVWVAFAGVVGSGCTPLNAGNGEWYASLFHVAVQKALDESVLESADDAALETLLEAFLWKEKYCGTALESLRQDDT